MNSLLIQARKVSRDPRECRRTIDALRRIGFGDDEFKQIHQFRASLSGFYSYSKKVQEFDEDGSNHRVHQRLTYVLLSCPGGALPSGKSFQTLAEEAIKLIPPFN
jgi:hypothetical protein